MAIRLLISNPHTSASHRSIRQRDSEKRAARVLPIIRPSLPDSGRREKRYTGPPGKVCAMTTARNTNMPYFLRAERLKIPPGVAQP